MKKFIENIAAEILNNMVENLVEGENNISFSLSTAKHDMDITISIKGGKTEMEEMVIYNEDGEDVTEKFGLFVEEMEKNIPTWEEIVAEAAEGLEPTTRIFGSEANYKKYRYGK